MLDQQWKDEKLRLMRWTLPGQSAYCLPQAPTDLQGSLSSEGWDLPCLENTLKGLQRHLVQQNCLTSTQHCISAAFHAVGQTRKKAQKHHLPFSSDHCKLLGLLSSLCYLSLLWAYFSLQGRMTWDLWILNYRASAPLQNQLVLLRCWRGITNDKRHQLGCLSRRSVKTLIAQGIVQLYSS